jgi:uncharacterized protein (TIGR00296 family)
MSKEYAYYAFDALVCSLLHTGPRIKINTSQASPLFVTWNKKEHGVKQLRGCIGNFGDLNLVKGIKEYALISAFEDTRFKPITKDELPLLSVSITILANFTPASNALDWELGRHGVRVSIHRNGRTYGATFLPDVAVEQGWTKEETIDHCVRKSGYRYPFELDEISVVRYEGVKVGCDYEEYQEYIKTL